MDNSSQLEPLTCSICLHKGLHPILSLGHQPPSNGFLKKDDLNKPETYYPLNVYYCERCHLVQLGYHVDRKIIFSEYVYTTGMNTSLIKNFSNLVNSLVSRFSLTKNDLAIDIGSNDGTLLSFYRDHGVRMLGIEPSSVSKIALSKGIPTLQAFFGKEVAPQVISMHGKAKVITATNVFAHVNDVRSFVEGIKELLLPKGVFVSESHHLLSVIAKMQWDSIYHEHLRYYSLKPLIRLFHDFGLEVFDAEMISTHGGSIRIYVCRKGDHPLSKNVQAIIEEETRHGLYSLQTFKEFGKRIQMHKYELQELLRKIKKEHKRIVGIGAPAKGNTLLNYCHINSDILDYLVEKSTLKIGLYTPGTHIKVVEEPLLFKENPEYALLLSWNIADELIAKLRDNGYKGGIIVPIPHPRIVE